VSGSDADQSQAVAVGGASADPPDLDFYTGVGSLMDKDFRLRPEHIKLIATGLGGGFASDSITVEGNKVGLMYRENPGSNVDSGWRFLSGLETPEYIENTENFGFYDINTVANYDPEIVPLLDTPIGSAFRRDPHTGRFGKVDFTPPEA